MSNVSMASLEVEHDADDGQQIRALLAAAVVARLALGKRNEYCERGTLFQPGVGATRGRTRSSIATRFLAGNTRSPARNQKYMEQ